MKYFRALIAAC